MIVLSQQQKIAIIRLRRLKPLDQGKADSLVRDDMARRFEQLVENMDIPHNRKRANLVNLHWFVENAVVLNRQYKYFNEALSIAKTLL